MNCSNLIELLRKLRAEKLTVADLKDQFRDLKIHYEPHENGRVVLCNARPCREKTPALIRQCRGVVLESGTWKVLALGMPALITEFKAANVSSRLQDFDVYEINDGTIVTLYHWKDKWCIASANGYDVSQYRWLGETTYLEAVEELMQKYNISWDELNPNSCYVIGFRHHSFHPLLADPQKLWFVGSFDLTSINSDNPTITPGYVPAKIPAQTKPNIKWAEMVINNKSALANFRQDVRMRYNTPRIHYGYILRSKSDGGDYLLESDLLKYIRQMLYNVPKDIKLDHKTRIDYIVMRAAMSATDRDFLSLYPQYKDKHMEFRRKLDEIARTIVNSMRQGRRDIEPAELNILKSTLSKEINAFDPSAERIVRDHLMNKKNIHYVFKLLSESK